WWFSWLLLACRRWRECACYFRVSPRIQPSTARWWCIRTLGGRTARRPHWHVQYPPTRLVKYLRDRKSTRLNSSHVSISYAVFCLKKKIQLALCCVLLVDVGWSR